MKSCLLVLIYVFLHNSTPCQFPVLRCIPSSISFTCPAFRNGHDIPTNVTSLLLNNNFYHLDASSFCERNFCRNTHSPCWNLQSVCVYSSLWLSYFYYSTHYLTFSPNTIPKQLHLKKWLESYFHWNSLHWIP